MMEKKKYPADRKMPRLLAMLLAVSLLLGLVSPALPVMGMEAADSLDGNEISAGPEESESIEANGELPADEELSATEDNGKLPADEELSVTEKSGELPADDTATEEDIALSVLDLPAAEVEVFYDPYAYAKAVSSLTSAYGGETESTLVVDTAEGRVYTGAGEELDRTADAVAEAASLSAGEAAELLEQSEYEVLSVEGDAVVISDPYDTARLMVTSDTGVDTSGAVRVLSYENEYILQYATSGDAAQAAELLAPEVASLEVDIPLTVADDDEWIYEAEEWFEEKEASLKVQNKATGEEGMFENQEDYLSWAVPYLGIDELLASYNEDLAEEVVVAVLDSGFDDVPGFFDDSRILPPLTVAESGDTSDAHARKHGTFVLGEIYEATPANVKLLPVRVYDDSGSMRMSNLIAALHLLEAYEQHVSLVNLSIGSSGDAGINYQGTAPDAILRELTANGTFFVGSAGNNQTTVLECYPAKSTYVAAVTAIDEDGVFADSFSNYGQEGYPIAFTAPGSSMEGVSPLTEDGVTTMHGTSMSAPYLVTCAALLMSQGKLAGLSGADDFISALTGYVRPGLTAGTDPYRYGAGCIGFPISIEDASLTFDNKDYEIRRDERVTIDDLTLTLGSLTLVNGADYTVSYENNDAPGQAAVIVTGTGFYGGEVVGHFDIYGEMADCRIEPIGQIQYTGNALTPESVVSFGGRTLEKDRDYTLSYAHNTEVGQATITLTGKGYCRGEVSCSFDICEKIDDSEVSLADELYNGEAIMPEPVVSFHGETLVKDRDYTLAFENNDDPGLATVTVTGIGRYMGEVIRTFHIFGSIGDCEIASIKDVQYTGNALMPEPAVTFHGKTLEKDRDYTLAYEDNRMPGIATVTVQGAGYYGNDGASVNVSFRILPLTPAFTMSNEKSGIRLSWKKIVGADGYIVYRRDGGVSDKASFRRLKKITSPDTLAYTDKTAESGSLYTYAVRAYCGSISGRYNTAEFYRIAGTEATARNAASGLRIDWTAVNGAAGYYIYRRKTTESAYTRIGRAGASRLYYIDKTAVNGTNYRYCVKPYHGTYIAPFLSSVRWTRVAPVTVSRVTSAESGEAVVRWQKNAKATGYQVRYSRKADFSNPVTVRVKGRSSLSKTLSSLASGKVYYVKVRAYRTVNGKNYYSAWSGAASVKVK